MTKFFGALTAIIQKLGYGGIFVCTGLEYACFPVSSELLLPFIGYAVSRGELRLLLAILFSTLGGICGCVLCYGCGRFGGAFIEKTLCRRFESVALGIDNAKKVFHRYGRQSVFIARVFPIARTYISIPAGMTRFPIGAFILYSGLGALLWNTVLISIGYFLGEHWQEAASFLKEHRVLLVLLIAAVVMSVLYTVVLKRKKRNAP